MKNIKKFISKNLAVFLSLAIILTTLLPVISGVVNIVSAETAEQTQAITALKEAWGKMYKKDTIMYPTIQKVSGTNTVADAIYATENGLDSSLPTGIDAEDLGDYYAYHSQIYSTTGTGNNRVMWSKSTTAFQTLAAKIDKYDDIQFSFYIEDVTVNSSSGAIQAYDNASSNLIEEAFVVTEEMKGKWSTFTSEDFLSGGIDSIRSALSSRNFGWIQLNFGDNKVKPKGWFGSLIGIINADVPDLSGIELIEAAKALDISEYSNTEDFVSALTVAEALFFDDTPKGVAVKNLKEAWGKMYLADTLMSPTIEKVSGTNTQSSVYNTADGIDALPAGITADDLGSYYAHHTGVYGTTGTAENRFMWSKDASGTGVTTANTDISVYDDLSVSFYVEEVATEGSFTVDLMCQGTSVDVANTTYNITKADEGKWITLHGDDMRVNGFDELISKMAEVNNGSYRLYFFQFGLGSNSTKFKGYFGSLVGIKNAVVPELSGVALVKAAMNLDLTGYVNTEAFEAALTAAEELYAEELIDYNLKTAWGEMGTTTSWLYPQFYRRASGSDQDNLYSVSNVLTAAKDIATYGEQTVTIDMQSSGRTAPDTTNSYTLFMGAKPTESLSAVQNRGRVANGTESDIYLYIKVNSVTTAGRIGFKAVGNSGQYLSSVTKDINSEAIGQWQKISFSDIMPMSSITDWKSFFSNTSNDYFGKFELMLLDGAVANLTISCIVREFAVTDVPELSGIELVKEAMSL
ncbi:MAG: hypothetical protein IJZ75_03605, partial [Clostridia bacterium]|nr:hypothetical protein [Clostridia bacterium]